jgi:hypothetical protein
VIRDWVQRIGFAFNHLFHVATQYGRTALCTDTLSLLLLRALQSMMHLGLFCDCSPYVRLQSLKVSQQLKLLTGWGRQPHAQHPTRRARVTIFDWIITFDLSGMGYPTSSYATAGTALRIISPRKPHHYVKVGIPTGAGIFCLGDHYSTKSSG